MTACTDYVCRNFGEISGMLHSNSEDLYVELGKRAFALFRLSVRGGGCVAFMHVFSHFGSVYRRFSSVARTREPNPTRQCQSKTRFIWRKSAVKISALSLFVEDGVHSRVSFLQRLRNAAIELRFEHCRCCCLSPPLQLRMLPL